MAMAAWGIAILALLVGGAWQADGSAFLLVHKTADVKQLKPGSERITVSLDIYNAGTTTAYDVSLIDDAWPSSIFNVVSGNSSAAWEKLEVGKSLKHTFVLEPKTKMLFPCSPAVVKYRVAAKSALQEALSTPLNPLELLSDKPAGFKYDFLKSIAVKYGPLASVVTIVCVFVYLMVTPSGPKKSKASRKRR